MSQQIAIVMTEVFLRRLTPALMPFVRRQQDFRVVSIHRPIDELLDLLRELQPDGLITEWLPEVTEALLSLDMPTVIADTDFSYPGVVSIDVDDYAVGAAAAEAFQQAGYRSFACLGNGTPYSGQRIDGFIQAVDLPVSVHTETAFEDARYSEHFVAPNARLRRWLESLPKPVGIFAVHDPLGRFLCSSCQQLGISVPEQVAVIGANNDDLVCGLSYPMLSSVAIPWDSIGALVGESMQDLLVQKRAPAEPVLVPPGGVVLRHSANHLLVDDPQLRRAMSYLSERMQDSISVGQMCDELRLARRSLERKFKEFYRCTPWEMLCRLRVAQAKQLLAQTNHPIGRISDLCGFNDAERMAVVFKRVAGEAPSSFRKNRR
ncbi:substrate-binding domain-containing protein [Coraliomargarita sp. SDUM461003]|uniref:Substrate-binding domain-containing protein n=1 Tax=Thalassobacterium maritimum TaxID=3041265 RepID=A0ABU1AU02_9BACT|nr:substrate-binding domain-containing protein [Coraliomargarita sp. SDUM461003]MDQ8207641.1 substrate-binding domain-containing protein [Coraliomargarita sp. SDUM461003]